MVCYGFQLSHLVWTMTVMLIAVAVYTMMGGMFSVPATDFLSFVVMRVGLLAVSFLIVRAIGMDAVVTAVREHVGPAGLNPLTADGAAPARTIAAKPAAERTAVEAAALRAAEVLDDRVTGHAMPKFLGVFLPVGLMGS